MKYILFTLLFLQSLYALSFTKQENHYLEQHPIIKVSNEKDWPPFDFNEKGIAKGYSVDYLTLLSHKIGVKFVFETDSWQNLITKIKAKELDIIHPISKNKERATYLDFTSSYIDLQNSIITTTDRKDIKTVHDLHNKTVAVVEGWNTTKFLKKHYPKIIYKSYASSKEKLEAVAFGEVDATIEGYFTSNYLIQKHILSNLKISGKLDDNRFEQKLYLAVHKDESIFKNILQKAMNSVTQEELNALNIKWINIQQEEIKNTITFSKQDKEYLQQKKKIVMCIDPDWMPYEKNDKGTHIGMSSDYMKIFQELLPIKIEYLPTSSWTESLELAKKRSCDILSLAVKTPLRSQYMDFTSGYLKLPLVIATKPRTPFISDINDILDKKIAVVKGHAYIELLRQKYPTLKLIEVSSSKEGFSKVLDEEVYGFLDSLASMGYKIQKDHLGNIKIAGKLDIELEIGMATRNDEKELLVIFEKLVNSVSQTKHREILNKWVSVTYNKPFEKNRIIEILIFVFIVSVFFVYRQFLLKRKNEVLQESNQEFEHLINSTIEAIFILEEGKVVDVNNEGVKLLGAKSKEEIIGMHALTFIDASFHELARKNLEQNFTLPYEAKAVKHDGTVFPVLIKGHKFRLKNKNVRVSALIDLTELKSKETLLLEQTKMAALGEMLANIAHQWRQPLSVISTATSGMKVQKSYNMLSDELFNEYNDAIMTNVNYLSQTIDDFKDFVKENKVSKAFNVEVHLQKNISILTPMLKSNSITVISQIDSTLVIKGVENELTQAIINIVSNAKDAFNDNDIKERYIFIKGYQEKENTIVTFQDSAGGIPNDVINKIFEPYFTTKHKSQGTGLGLYMTRKIIVESMNGKIEVGNDVVNYKGKSYKGACFRLTL